MQRQYRIIAGLVTPLGFFFSNTPLAKLFFRVPDIVYLFLFVNFDIVSHLHARQYLHLAPTRRFKDGTAIAVVLFPWNWLDYRSYHAVIFRSRRDHQSHVEWPDVNARHGAELG